jgi:hypothetical protein
LGRKPGDAPPNPRRDGVKRPNDLLLVAKRTMMRRVVQSSVHVREQPDDGVLQDLANPDRSGRRMTQPRPFDALQGSFGLSSDGRVLVAEFEGELVNERDVDRFEELVEEDSLRLPHQIRKTPLTLVVGLHVEVCDDSGGDWRVAEHRRNVGIRGVGDLLEERPLVVEDDARECVFASDAKEGLSRLVEALEGSGESGGRGEEDGAEDGEVGLDEGVRLDAAMRGRLRKLKFRHALEEGVAVPETAEDANERFALEKSLRFRQPGRRKVSASVRREERKKGRRTSRVCRPSEESSR